MKNTIIRLTVILLVFVAGIFYYTNHTKEEVFENKTKMVELKNPEEKKAETKDKVVNEEKNKEEVKPKAEEPNVSNNQKEKADNSSSEKKEVKQTAPKKEQEVKKETPIQNTNAGVVSTPKNEPIIEAKKQEVWEALGMTKDQYYNQPLYSWEKVDFDSYAECETFGDTYPPAVNGEVSYVCRDVKSPSGKYLGTMFDSEKLN